jgi:hypothetical protein
MFPTEHLAENVMGAEQAEVRKRGKARLLTCGGALFLPVAAIAGLVFACVDLPVQPQRLADGGTYSLLGYTTPNQPELVTGAPLFRWLEPIQSTAVEQRLGIRRLKHPGGQLALWIKRTPPRGFDPMAASSMDPRFSNYWMPLSSGNVATVSDEEGRLASLPYPNDMQAIGIPSFEAEVTEICVTTLPRRGRHLTVRIYPFQKDLESASLATFQIHNPYFGNYPEWKPVPLPARQRTGELEVELVSLRNGSLRDSTGETFPGYFNHAVVKIRRGSLPCEEWEPDHVWFQDATGNSWDESSPQVKRERPGTFRVVTGGNLWDEPAWKLRLQVARVRDFAIGDQCNVSTLMPRKGIYSAQRAQGHFDGTNVQVTSVAAKESDMRFGGMITKAWSQAVIVRVSGKHTMDEVRLVGVAGGHSRWMGQQSGVTVDGNQFFWLPVGVPAGPLRLTFARHRTRTVTFVVRPDQELRKP